MEPIASDLRQWRKAQRAEMLARRNAQPSEERHELDRAITDTLLAGFPLLRAMTIGVPSGTGRS